MNICIENYNNDFSVSPLAKCTHCGKAIYNSDEAMIISLNKRIIHTDCWADYALENYEEFLEGFYI